MYCMVLMFIYIFAIQTSWYRKIVCIERYFEKVVTKKINIRLNYYKEELEKIIT